MSMKNFKLNSHKHLEVNKIKIHNFEMLYV